MTTETTSFERRLDEFGLRRVGEGRCPRQLVGKQHMGYKCWCASPLNDNSATYVHSRGTRLVIWEPYVGSARALDAVLRAALADGLDVEVSGTSLWNPGYTFVLCFEAAHADPSEEIE